MKAETAAAPEVATAAARVGAPAAAATVVVLAVVKVGAPAATVVVPAVVTVVEKAEAKVVVTAAVPVAEGAAVEAGACRADTNCPSCQVSRRRETRDIHKDRFRPAHSTRTCRGWSCRH